MHMHRKGFFASLLGALGVLADAEARTMDIQISIPDADGLNLVGVIPITVEVHPTANLRYVQILIDGALAVQDTTAPYMYAWDTTKSSDGTHVIQGIAQYKTRKSQTQIAVTVNNAASPPPGTVTQTIIDGSTIPDIKGWRAVYDANGDGIEDDPGKIEFIVDGNILQTELDPPFGDSFAAGSITVASGAHIFQVRALDDSNVLLASNSVHATVEPVVPINALFDGRAILMTSLYGSTKKIGDANWDGNSNATQSPILWGMKPTDVTDGLYFMTDSISLVADATFSKVYRCNIGPGDTNPYFNQPTKPNGELTILRPITMGQVDWYADAFKIVSPYTVMGFDVIAQYGYPSLTSPPLSISFDNTGLGIDRHVGTVQSVGSLTGMTIEKPRFWTVDSVLDKWVEMVVGVKWSMDGTGFIAVYARVRDLGDTTLTLRHSRTDVITFQQLQGSGIKTSVNDKMGLYFGTSSTPPTNTVLHRGFTRWDNQADAIASMG